MIFHSYIPSSILQNTIAYFWTLESCPKTEGNGVFNFIPDAYVDWIFHLEAPWEFRYTRQNSAFQKKRTHLFSHAQEFIEIKLPKQKMLLFGIKFQPWAAHQMWNLNMGQLTDVEIGCKDLNDSFLKKLEEQINLQKSVPDMIVVCETNFIHRLSALPSDNLSPIIAQLFNNPFLRTLPKFSNSQRRLEQRFKNEIGISPKMFQRTIRINHVIEKMINTPQPHLTSIAYEMGYYDQSHFIRDFKKFTGSSPSKFLKSINPSGDIFNLKSNNSERLNST
jgi:AraC-like DNA-binding protein